MHIYSVITFNEKQNTDTEVLNCWLSTNFTYMMVALNVTILHAVKHHTM